MGQYGFPVSDLVTNGDGAVLRTRGADGTNWVFTERAGTVTVTQDTGAVEKKESKPTPAAPKTAAEQITATAQDAFGSDGNSRVPNPTVDGDTDNWDNATSKITPAATNVKVNKELATPIENVKPGDTIEYKVQIKNDS